MFPRLGDSVKILYGGSVKTGNIEEIMSVDEVHGVLVGGASLSADSFFRIIKSVEGLELEFLIPSVKIIHIVVSILLVLIILLQPSKSADIGSMFGGGSSESLFGSSGAMPFLVKMTRLFGLIFVITSLFSRLHFRKIDIGFSGGEIAD